MKEISLVFFVDCAADMVRVSGNVRLDLSSCYVEFSW